MSSQSHTLGRIDLSSDDTVSFIETDESEDDLSDHSARVVTDGNARRRQSLPQNTRGTQLPSRSRNMSSASASRRFRRTSSRPERETPPSSINSTMNNLWEARGAAGAVDQSVNIMDVEFGGVTAPPSRARPGMGTYGQKSMVDVFLSEENQTRGSLGVGSSHVRKFHEDKKDRRRKWCINVLVLAVPLVIIVALLQVIPSSPGLGLAGGGSSDNNKETTPAPTPAPTDAPEPEVVIEEEAEVPPKEEEEEKEQQQQQAEEEEEVDRPLPEPTTQDDGMDLHDVPQTSRIKAFEYFVIDQDVTEEAQLNIMGSPSKKALHWITQKDRLKLGIPGYENEVTADNQKESELALLQRYALAVFFYSMQAASSSSSGGAQGRKLYEYQPTDEELANRAAFDREWLNSKPTCQWRGVTCDKDSIIEIQLPHHYLQGTIPRELLNGAALPFIRILDLKQNQLHGTLPVVARERNDAGSHLKIEPPASTMKVLGLAKNQLTGSLDNLMGMTSLSRVDLSRNGFTGKIPEEIANFEHLEDLRLSDNRLTGALPAESLGELTSMRVLRLESNSLAEELPTTLSALTNLQELKLSANGFGGQIPDSYGDLTNLQILDMDGNGIEGQVPTSLGKLTALEKLQLAGNELTGNMPVQICSLRQGPLSRLETDCADGNIVCNCCSECY